VSASEFSRIERADTIGEGERTVRIEASEAERAALAKRFELKSVDGSPVVVWRMTVQQGGTYRSYRIGSLYPGVIWAG